MQQQIYSVNKPSRLVITQPQNKFSSWFAKEK